MTDEMTAERLAEIRQRANAATEGPWERGDRWHIQGAAHCKCTEDHGPLVHEGRMNINGEMMQAHVHRRPKPIWEHGITTATPGKDGRPVDVVVETTEYGTMRDDDAEFISHARADIPDLLTEVERLRGEVQRLESSKLLAASMMAESYCGEEIERLRESARKQAADELTRMRYHDEQVEGLLAEIEELREQVEALQAVRWQSVTEIYAIETWIDAEAWSSGWGYTEVITTGKHDALERLRYLHQTYPDQEFRLVEAKRTSWLPVTEEGPTP